jgi:P-type E1-E2 ATPase
MDKTGTLTSGKMTVTAVIPVGGFTEEDVLQFAGLAEHSSSHPVAKAIVSAAIEKQVILSISSNATNHPGLGVADTQEGQAIHVGNLMFFTEQGISVDDTIIQNIRKMNQEGAIVVLVSVQKTLAGLISLTDQIRPESASVITSLRNMQITGLHLLTGDSNEVAQRIAKSCGILPAGVHAGMHPRDKETFIAELQQQGNIVCYVGDGTNDGPALARADLGISIGSREDTIALETSSVILMKGDLASLPTFIALGKRTRTFIIANIIIALLLNTLLIMGAASGILSPAMGAIGHQVATIAVLLNSSRLAIHPGLITGPLKHIWSDNSHTAH